MERNGANISFHTLSLQPFEVQYKLQCSRLFNEQRQYCTMFVIHVMFVIQIESNRRRHLCGI